MDHSIKLNRAQRQSNIGSYPGSWCHMLGYVPEAARAKLSASELAQLVDAIWDACAASKTLALHDACDEGAIWDDRAQRLAPIVMSS